MLWHFPHDRFPRGRYSVIRSSDFKLIKWYAEDGYEVFNLAEDLSETNDLAPAMPEKVRELDARLTAMLKECEAKLLRATAEFRASSRSSPVRNAADRGPITGTGSNDRRT